MNRMKPKANLGGVGTMVLLAIVLAGVVGWIMNIVDIVNTWAWPMTGMLVVRIIGAFVAPLGAVLGYF